MADSNSVIVDTNILFSALLKEDSRFAREIIRSERTFYIGESTLVELFKHKEKLVQQSKLSDEDVIRLLYTLMQQMVILKEGLIDPAVRRRAITLCQGIDMADAPQVALTLHMDGLLWTGDKALKKSLRAKGFDAFFEP